MCLYLPCRVTLSTVTDCSEAERSILMFAEMTLGSNCMVPISRKGIERNLCALRRHQKPRSDKICHYPRTKNQRHPKSPILKTCLTFCFKDQTTMEQREPHMDPQAEEPEGRLRELASRWFIDTQVSLIVHNGFFPSWFLGFITRKDAEEILKEKELGCFLIRLSDKAIGYILSYRGRDRCRHFMINQCESGQLVVCGDIEVHDTVSDLTEYYKTHPIQPFGEYLTSACFEVLNEELYDVIQVSSKETLLGSIGAKKDVQKPRISSDLEQPPTRPPKSSRTLQEAPPLPQRSRNLDSSLLNDQDGVMYAQLRERSPRVMHRSQHMRQDNLPGDNPGRAERSKIQDQNIRRLSPASAPNCVYSELHLLDKSRSLPPLVNSCDGEQPHRRSAPPQTPPRLSPKLTREATSYGAPAEKKTGSSHSLQYMSDSAVYYLAGRPGRPSSPLTTSPEIRSDRHRDPVYAEVPSESIVGRFPRENTYELIWGDKNKLQGSSNTCEPLEDIRPKHNNSSWELKNDKWKRLFPEVKRKW